MSKDKDDSDQRQGNDLGQEAVKAGPLFDKFDTRGLRKIPSMFERVVSALIDDESEEVYLQTEGKNLSPHVSDDSHCGSCNQMDIDSKDRERIESEVESAVEQNQKLCLLDRLSCNKGGPSSTFRNSGMSTSGYSNEQSFGDDDYSHVEMGLVSEICSSDIVKLQQKELYISGFPFPDEQYHLKDINDRVILELRSIDLCPEILVWFQYGIVLDGFYILYVLNGASLFLHMVDWSRYLYIMQPDLAEEDLISDDIIELKGKLYEKVTLQVFPAL